MKNCISVTSFKLYSIEKWSLMVDKNSNFQEFLLYSFKLKCVFFHIVCMANLDMESFMIAYALVWQPSATPRLTQ